MADLLTGIPGLDELARGLTEAEKANADELARAAEIAAAGAREAFVDALADVLAEAFFEEFARAAGSIASTLTPGWKAAARACLRGVAAEEARNLQAKASERLYLRRHEIDDLGRQLDAQQAAQAGTGGVNG